MDSRHLFIGFIHLSVAIFVSTKLNRSRKHRPRSFLFANIEAARYLTERQPTIKHIFKAKTLLNMTRNIAYNIDLKRFYSILITVFLFFTAASCENKPNNSSQTPAKESVIKSIDGVDQFNKIIQTAGDRLLLIDFYADWCPPCKDLMPILEKIAKEKSENVTIYKINIDRNSNLANSFRVTGIPQVTFIKNKENVLSLTGLYPKKMYLKAIEQHSEAGAS